MNDIQPANQSNEEEGSIDFKKIVDQFLSKWPWFILSLLAFLLAAWLYVHYTPPTYKINAKVLVKEGNQPGAAQASALMDLGGILGSKSSVDNEVEILKTRFLMERVVRDLQLNIVYTQKGRILVQEVDQAPFQLEIIDNSDSLDFIQLEVIKLANQKMLVKANGTEKEVSVNQEFKIQGLGTAKILSNSLDFPVKGDFIVSVYPIDARVNALMGQLSVATATKQVSVIDLGFIYPVKRKGEEILGALIKQYASANLQDKNLIADSTSKFIKDRLSIIAGELGDVEVKQQKFKQNNQLADLSEQSKLLVQNTAELTSELAKAETQVSLVNDLERYLKDESKNKRIFPTSLLPSDIGFTELLGQYNTLLIERDRNLLDKTEDNPVVKNIDVQIASLRAGILSNVQSTKNTFVVTRDKLKNQLQQIENRVSEVPQIEKDYLKLARNQQIKQELYIFLMQKAEETAISKTANISISKTIDPPKAESRPVSPKPNTIYAIAFIFSLVLPIAIIYLADLLNTSINNKEDLTNNSKVPIIGEISHDNTDDNLIITNHNRSAISEQFRALRTNLSFYLKNADEKVILLTSSMSGEGKSFTALNLGGILALAGKKVLLMELDLRKPGLSTKLGLPNKLGFSNYAINTDLNAADIIQPLSIHPNMFFISSGPLPPNPAETLMDARTASLLAELKSQFDYVIMDAPPIGIVTDAQLLAPYADLTLYLVRQHVTQKKQLMIVNDLYHSGRMKNMGIVINDIDAKFNGYGYGYGEYGGEQSKSLFRRIFKS